MAMEYDGYKSLAAAIVLQAIQDFKRDARIVKAKSRDAHLAEKDMREIVKFVNSDWFDTLCDIPPSVVLNMLKEELRK